MQRMKPPVRRAHRLLASERSYQLTHRKNQAPEVAGAAIRSHAGLRSVLVWEIPLTWVSTELFRSWTQEVQIQTLVCCCEQTQANCNVGLESEGRLRCSGRCIRTTISCW